MWTLPLAPLARPCKEVFTRQFLKHLGEPISIVLLNIIVLPGTRRPSGFGGYYIQICCLNLYLLKIPRKNKRYSPKSTLVRPKIKKKKSLKQNQVNHVDHIICCSFSLCCCCVWFLVFRVVSLPVPLGHLPCRSPQSIR